MTEEDAEMLNYMADLVSYRLHEIAERIKRLERVVAGEGGMAKQFGEVPVTEKMLEIKARIEAAKAERAE